MENNSTVAYMFEAFNHTDVVSLTSETVEIQSFGDLSTRCLPSLEFNGIRCHFTCGAYLKTSRTTNHHITERNVHLLIYKRLVIVTVGY